LRLAFVRRVLQWSWLAIYGQTLQTSQGRLPAQARRTIGARTALFHFREHLAGPHAKTRAQVVADCPDYRLVADVVNVTKHGTLTRPTSEGPPLVDSADDIEERTIITRYEDEQGEYSDPRTLVFVNCSDGVCRNLDTALTTVLNYWGGELKRLGIVKYTVRDAPEMPGTRFVPRVEARAHNLEATQGLRWKQTWQLRKFDVSKGHSVPIDLKDKKIEFRIYKPPRSVDIMVELPGGGEAIKFSVDLTEEQSLALLALKTVAEREAFLKPIVDEQRNKISEAINTTLKTRTEAAAVTGEARSASTGLKKLATFLGRMRGLFRRRQGPL
jgi:hypothetical protein